MRDLGHEWTERRIRELEKRIRDAYEWAIDDIDDKMQAYIARFVKRDAELRDQLKAGKITQADYRMWMNGQVFQKKRWQATLDDLTETLARANQIAMQIVNEETPEVFAYNANWASYNFEREMDRRGHDLSVIRRPGGVEPEDKKEPPAGGARVQFGWGLYSAEAVKILLRDEPTLLPPSRVDIPKDRQWNMKNITRQILQGIVQGEGVEDVAKRLRTVAEMNIDSARTHARTAMTAAQNAGRMEQMQRSIELAAKFGEKVQKKWKSAKDSRVRRSHGILDGQIRDPDEPFEVDGKEIMFPGDPQAPPELVYNCRCAVSEYYPDSPPQNAKMRDDDPDRVPIRSMTFKEWQEWKRGEGEEAGMYRKTANTGAFASLPERMSKKHIREIAKEFGIDLKGVALSIIEDKELLDNPNKYYAVAAPEEVGRIYFYPWAFESKEQLTRTLFHEKIHIEQYRKYGPKHVTANREMFEREAYEAEEEFAEKLKKEGKL